MFFSPELLSKRDSGFGLLWLAATLGSKSAFKKLPKRSVLTADISRLCDLIASPSEPLALRLSSNLMFGAARVYKVKQEIFLADVTTCFNSLKRVVQEFHSIAASEAQLQMAQPSVKPSTVTLAADPGAVFSMDLDAMVADWDEYLNIGNNKTVEMDSTDDEYNPKAKKQRGKGKQSTAAPVSTVENARVNAHTLNENHDIFLTNSFDASFGGSGAAMFSSSQNDNFGFEDSFFGAFDDLDIGEGIGDDLLNELGEGWGGAALDKQIDNDMQVCEQADFAADPDNLYFEHDASNNDIGRSNQNILPLPPSAVATPQFTQRNSPAALPPTSSMSGNSHESPSGQLAIITMQTEEDAAPHNNITSAVSEPAPKKTKRTRLLLDVRTELTDDELKAARLHYLEEQDVIHRQLARRNFERNQGNVIDDLLWGVPGHMQAQELVDFWLDHFKAQLEARSEFMVESKDDSPPSKRRKTKIIAETSKNTLVHAAENLPFDKDDAGPDDVNVDVGGMDMNFEMGGWDHVYDVGLELDLRRSSEEPGQARHASRPPSVLGDNFGLNIIQNSISQRSALFPWDNAGASSSVSGAMLLGHQSSDKVGLDLAETRMRGSSVSRRGSSLLSQHGEVFGGIGNFPTIINGSPQINDEEFIFDVAAGNSVADSQLSDVNIATLERNSFNFLEYAKMQYKSRPGSPFLSFDDVVPQDTSTAHVAAAALYHCLVLGTRDLVRLRQESAYGRIEIRIKV